MPRTFEQILRDARIEGCVIVLEFDSSEEIADYCKKEGIEIDEHRLSENCIASIWPKEYLNDGPMPYGDAAANTVVGSLEGLRDELDRRLTEKE